MSFGYNLSQIRILWEIATDGLMWNSIISSSSDSNLIPGDFSVYNTKTDIVEQVWRTGIPNDGVAWILLDVGKDGVGSRAISIDTFALLNHNFTSEAKITVRGYGISSDSKPTRDTVKTSGTVLFANETPNALSPNFIWVSENEQTNKFRYWLIEIEDSKNTSSIGGKRYLQIGRIIGGQATVFTEEENITANFSYQEVSYKDEVKINGFTSISNTRAMKKKIRISFKNLNSFKSANEISSATNYLNLRKYMRHCRDTLKALVILDSRDPYSFHAFAKLSELPTQDCNYVTEKSLYVSMDLEWDEAK